MIDIESWRKYQAKLRRVKKSYARRRKVTDVTPRPSESESPAKRKKKDPASFLPRDHESEAIRKAIHGNNISHVHKTPDSGDLDVKCNKYCETGHTAPETIPSLNETVRYL